MTSKSDKGSPPEPDNLLDLLDHFKAFFDELERETDRGLALIVAAHLDELLGRAIKRRFTIMDDSVASLFWGQSPLGSFSTRISVGYGLGIYAKNVRDDLNRINAIRREFAHRLFPNNNARTRELLSLKKSPLRDHCFQLEAPEHEFEVVLRFVASRDMRPEDRNKTIHIKRKDGTENDPRARLIFTSCVLSGLLLAVILDKYLTVEATDPEPQESAAPRRLPPPPLSY